MTELPQPEVNLPHGYQVGSIVATPIPDERTFPLRLDQFQILCSGMNSEFRSGMYFFVGVLVSSLAGLFSLFQNADWPTFWSHQRVMLLYNFAFLACDRGWVNSWFFYLLVPTEKEKYSLLDAGSENSDPL